MAVDDICLFEGGRTFRLTAWKTRDLEVDVNIVIDGGDVFVFFVLMHSNDGFQPSSVGGKAFLANFFQQMKMPNAGPMSKNGGSLHMIGREETFSVRYLFTNWERKQIPYWEGSNLSCQEFHSFIHSFSSFIYKKWLLARLVLASV